MRYVLKLKSLDDDPQELTFDSKDDAIKYAVNWFVDGYDNETIDRATRIEVAGDAVELARDLREGREFYCPRFYETVSICALDA